MRGTDYAVIPARPNNHKQEETMRASLLVVTSVLLLSTSLLLGRGEAQAVIVIDDPDFSSVAAA